MRREELGDRGEECGGRFRVFSSVLRPETSVLVLGVHVYTDVYTHTDTRTLTPSS